MSQQNSFQLNVKKVFAYYAAHFLWLVSALLCCSVRISSSFLDCRNAKIHQNPIPLNNLKKIITGKSFSKALVLASTNPQYDKKLFVESPIQEMKTTSAEHGQNMARTCSAHTANIYSGNWDTRKKCKSYKYLP